MRRSSCTGPIASCIASIASRLASVVALTVTTSTWASLPFYSPDYTFDSTTGTGFKFLLSGDVTPDGKAAYTMRYYESNVALNYVIAAWRGPTPLPTPLENSDHINPLLRHINRYGWMCGITEQADGNGAQPAVWRPDGTRIDLPVLPSPFPNPSRDALHMNDAGVVVGKAWKDDEFGPDFGDRPVYWPSASEIVELANPFVTSNQIWNGSATSISSNGIIAGTVFMNDNTVWRAMRWDLDGTAPILSQTTNTGLTFTRTEAFESLDDGTILGWGLANNAYTGILWTPDGEAIELRKLPNSIGQVAEAYEVNNDRYSVGTARNSLGQQVGTLWSSTGEPFALDRLQDAPSNALEVANDINDFNFVVGRSQAGSTYRRAVLWTPDGDAIDMNSLVADDEWSFVNADTITNTGWIIGVGNFDPAGPAETYRRPFSILVPFAGTYGMGDANFDESIDFADLLIVAQHYGTQTDGSVDAGDFNLDGVVDFTDLLTIAQHYGFVLGQSVSSLIVGGDMDFTSDWQRAQTMVPEPGVVGLIGVGWTLRRRKRA